MIEAGGHLLHCRALGLHRVHSGLQHQRAYCMVLTPIDIYHESYIVDRYLDISFGFYIRFSSKFHLLFNHI